MFRRSELSSIPPPPLSSPPKFSGKSSRQKLGTEKLYHQRNCRINFIHFISWIFNYYSCYLAGALKRLSDMVTVKCRKTRTRKKSYIQKNQGGYFQRDKPWGERFSPKLRGVQVFLVRGGRYISKFEVETKVSKK